MFLDDIVGQMSMEEAKATSQRLDAKCWKGKHKEGTKIKGGVRVNNCVPNESQTNEVAAGGGAPAVPSDAQLKKMIWDALKIDAPTGKEALQKAIINLSQRPQTPMVKNMLGRIGMIADNMNIGPEYRTLLKKFVEDSWSSETTPWGGQDPFTSGQHEMVEDQLDEYPIQGPSPDDSQSPIHGLEEEFGDSPVTGAITRRILMQRADLLKQYGPELVGAAIDNVADYVGDVDEIGSSDVSGWVNQVERMLKENPPEAFAEDQADQVKKVFKDKAGQPVGEIGIDPESSPGNGEWYVHHYATGYSVVGFDSAAEAKRELLYVHKHPDAVEGHPSTTEQGVAEDSRGSATQRGQQDYAKGLSRQQNPYYKSQQGQTPPAAYDWEAGWEYARDADKEPGVAEGWSDRAVAQRTGQPRTPYSVYIKGQKWKDFENDDHAQAVANKLRAKFRADGRDPETITIAPTDMSEGVVEAEKKGLYYNVNKRKAAGTSRPASSPTAPTAQAWKDAAKTAKKESVEEEWSKKYKSSINCSNPKGFSQKAHCAGKKKNEDVEESQTDYSKRRQRERDVDAGKPVAKQRPSKMTDYQKRRAQDKKDMELGEGTNYWTKLQSERSTRLNTLVNELKESVKDIK